VFGYELEEGSSNASHSNFHVPYNSKCGEYSKKSNADFVENTTRTKKWFPDSIASARHIQCYCPALQLPHIAIHHGRWMQLIFSIQKSSIGLNDAKEP